MASCKTCALRRDCAALAQAGPEQRSLILTLNFPPPCGGTRYQKAERKTGSPRLFDQYAPETPATATEKPKIRTLDDL